jgi:predicted KAP-like P-loop ATPase
VLDVLEIHTYALQVKKDLSILVELLQQQPPWLQAQPLRILVFIDDLDRCRPSKVVEVLEAVNLVLGPSGFTVVVGMVSNLQADLD